MSAPDALPDEAVERLGRAIYDALLNSNPLYWEDAAEEIATDLAPVVAALVREASAATWDEAADELLLSSLPSNHWAVVGFRSRAATVRSQP